MAATEAGLRAAGAIEVLYRDHVGTVYRYAYAVLGNHSDAEDVTQTTFVNALRALERGESPRKPENWLLTIAHNIVRQRWRHQQSRPTEVELDTDLVGAEDDERADLDGIVRALQRIPPSQREALVMRELEGRSYQEIAQILDLTTSALETLLFRARRSLAEEIENLVTCDRAEGAISRQLDGRLSRKERRRLQEHLRECPSCARLAKSQTKYRGALRGLALLPIPASLTLFKGTSSAAAAALPTIGAAGAGAGAGVGVGVGTGIATTAAGGGALLGGAAAKVAAVVAAAAVVGGGGYAGVTTIAGDTPPKTQKPAVTTPAKTKQATKPKATGATASNGRRSEPAAAAPAGSKSKGKSAVAPGRVKEPGTPASPDRGRSAVARQNKGQAVRATKGNAQRAVKGKPAAATKKPATAGGKGPAAKPKPAPAAAKATAKPKTVEKTAPAASQGAGKGAQAGKGRQGGKAAAAASTVDAPSSRAGKAASSDLEAEEISGIAPAAADKPGKGAGGGNGRKTR